MQNSYCTIFEEENGKNDHYQLKKKTKFSEIDFSKTIIYEGKLNIQTKKSKFESRLFKLLDKKLVFYKKVKNDEKLKGYYNLLEFFRLTLNEYQENSKSALFSFTLSKNGKSDEFFSSKHDKIKQWFDSLKLYCICDNFRDFYKQEVLLGKGHFAEVYKVIQRDSNNSYVGKIMKKDKAYFEQKRFIRNEILVLKTISKNENIIRLYEIFENQLELVLIFELMEGGDLYAQIKKKKFLEHEAWQIFIQIIKGLNFLHLKGIIHRDIKLDNILLSNKSNPVAKIADFSLAEFYKNKSLNVKCGTPGFMAPEIFNNEYYDQRVDIFGAGIILYILLSGSIPFKAENCKLIISKNKNCVIKFKKKDWKHVSIEGKQLVMSMLQRDPEQRISLTNILTHKFVIQHYLEEQKINKEEIIINPKIKEKHQRNKKWKKSVTGSPDIINYDDIEEKAQIPNSIEPPKIKMKKEAMSTKTLGNKNNLQFSLKPPIDFQNFKVNGMVNGSHQMDESNFLEKLIENNEHIKSIGSMFIALDSKSDISEISSMTMNSANFLTKNEKRSRSFLSNNASVDIGTHMNILDRINNNQNAQEIFNDENPVEKLLKRLNTFSSTKPSKKF